MQRFPIKSLAPKTLPNPSVVRRFVPATVPLKIVQTIPPLVFSVLAGIVVMTKILEVFEDGVIEAFSPDVTKLVEVDAVEVAKVA